MIIRIITVISLFSLILCKIADNGERMSYSWNYSQTNEGRFGLKRDCPLQIQFFQWCTSKKCRLDISHGPINNWEEKKKRDLPLLLALLVCTYYCLIDRCLGNASKFTNVMKSGYDSWKICSGSEAEAERRMEGMLNNVEGESFDNSMPENKTDMVEDEFVKVVYKPLCDDWVPYLIYLISIRDYLSIRVTLMTVLSVSKRLNHNKVHFEHRLVDLHICSAKLDEFADWEEWENGQNSEERSREILFRFDAMRRLTTLLDDCEYFLGKLSLSTASSLFIAVFSILFFALSLFASALMIGMDIIDEMNEFTDKIKSDLEEFQVTHLFYIWIECVLPDNSWWCFGNNAWFYIESDRRS